jgi:hypothetical protein
MVEGVREQVRWRDRVEAQRRVAAKRSDRAQAVQAFEVKTTIIRDARTQI